MSPTAFMRKLPFAKVAARLLRALVFIVLVTMLMLESHFFSYRFIAPLIQKGFDNCFDTMLQAQRDGMELDQVIPGYMACTDQVERYHVIPLGVFVGMCTSAVYVAFIVIDRHIAITIGKSDQSPIRVMEFIRSRIVYIVALVVTITIATLITYQIII